jgi:hypothetical protein
LSFLEAIDFRAVPRALHEDRARSLGLYEFVEGEPVVAHSAADLGAVADLLGRLHECRAHPAARELPVASAAHFSAAELIAQIEGRYVALRGQDDAALSTFLEHEFRPEFQRCRTAVGDAYACKGVPPDRPLEEERRSLSPSDFGFHNALRRADGSLVFLDFEYFGKDDPVNATGNFLWHPGFVLSGSERVWFEGAAARIYGGDPDFVPRLRTLLPLYPLRWAMIALNEFLPVSWERRRGAESARDLQAEKTGQLRKAASLVAAAREVRSS